MVEYNKREYKCFMDVYIIFFNFFNVAPISYIFRLSSHEFELGKILAAERLEPGTPGFFRVNRAPNELSRQ